MKTGVMWIMMICLLVGGSMALLGRFIEKTIHLMGMFKGEPSQSKLGDRLFWWGAGLFSIGLVLVVWVYPNL